jgi:predicted MFS family arabinose efflux permease
MDSSKGGLLPRILGGDLEPGLGPVLATVGLGVTAMYAFWAYFAVWAIGELGMARGDVGLAYLAAAGVGICGGIAGGAVSDRLGRKPVILAGASAQTLLCAALLVPGLPVAGAVAVLALLTLWSPVRGAATQALIADLVPPERREAAFGSMRIAFNTGALAGPVLGAGLVAVGWHALHAGVALLYALSLLAAARLPRLEPLAAAAGERPSFRAIVGAPAFGVFFAAALFAMTTYNAFETLMPVSLTQEHGYPPAAWGVLFAVNPLLVTLFQLRVTRWSGGLAPGTKLGVAMLLMGGAFLPLALTTSPFVLVALLVVFVAGEMLWAPASDALAARLAPREARGAALGTLGIATWIGGALAPAVGFRVADAGGDAAMWVGIAAVGALAAGLYSLAARAGRGEPAAEPLAEAA